MTDLPQILLILKTIKELPKGANIIISANTDKERKEIFNLELEKTFISIDKKNDYSGEYYIIDYGDFKNKKIYFKGHKYPNDFSKIQGMKIDFWYRYDSNDIHNYFEIMAKQRLWEKKGNSIYNTNDINFYISEIDKIKYQ